MKSPILWIAALGLTVLLLLRLNIVLKKNNKRLKSNQEIILQDLKTIRLSNNKIAQEVGVLKVKNQELKRLYPKALKDIKALNIAKRKVLQYAQNVTSTQFQFAASLSDSFSNLPHKHLKEELKQSNDSIPYKVFHYRDNYYSVDGVAKQDIQWVQISSRDTLVQVVYRHRKHKWLWIFSPFIYHQRVQCKNPNASIYYSQIIQIEK